MNTTYKLLYNGTVAMTGGQDAVGGQTVPEIATALLAHGVAEVLVTTDDVSAYRSAEMPVGPKGAVKVWDRDRVVEAQEYLATVPGVTVMIHDQACAAQARRLRKRGLVETPPYRIAINHRICEACGDCGAVSNCLSVQAIDTPLGTKTTIDQSSCNLDYSCLEGDCPSFIQITPNPKAKKKRTRVSSAAISPIPTSSSHPAHSTCEWSGSVAPVSSPSPRSSPRLRCSTACTCAGSTRPASRRKPDV